VRATSFAIEYRDDDNKSQITREDGTVIAYDYDDANRLVEEKWTASDQTVVHHFEYSYDPTGNRLTKTYNGTTTDYDYNSLNQLTQEQTGSDVTEYAYDKDGNTIRKVEPGKTTLFSWNHENMLTRAEFSDATPTNYFGYDVDSVRVEKVASNGRIQTHTDALNLILERAAADIDAAFAHGHPEVYSVGSQVIHEGDAESYFYVHDSAGSVWALVDPSQAEVQRTERDAFGAAIAQSGGLGDPFGYLGKQWYGDLGLYQLGRRLYSPATGRFLTRDPLPEMLRDTGRTNARDAGSTYVYAGANPVLFVDPFGLAKKYVFKHHGKSVEHAVDVCDPKNVEEILAKIRFSASKGWTFANKAKLAGIAVRPGDSVAARTPGLYEQVAKASRDPRSAVYTFLEGILKDGLKEMPSGHGVTVTREMVEELADTGIATVEVAGESRGLTLVISHQGEADEVARTAAHLAMRRIGSLAGPVPPAVGRVRAAVSGVAKGALRVGRFSTRVAGKVVWFVSPAMLVLTFSGEKARGEDTGAAALTAVDSVYAFGTIGWLHKNIPAALRHMERLPSEIREYYLREYWRRRGPF